ncbi:unnamed protein product [Discosporangium mesarthrocarpum]
MCLVVSIIRVTGILCKSHSIDLYLEDICKEDWAVRINARVKRVVNFLKRYQKTLAMLQAEDGTKTLLLPNDTRFGTNIIMMQCVKKV